MRSLWAGFILGFLCSVGAAPDSLAAMGAGKALPRDWNVSAGRGYVLAGTISGNPISAMCVECHFSNPSPRTQDAALPGGEPETDYRGSHFVWNQLDGTERTTAAERMADSEKVTPWAATGGNSLYGDRATTTSIQTAGEMICESCHSLAANLGANLLLDVIDTDSGASTLCEGCHTIQSGGPPDHHPMTGDNVGRDAESSTEHQLDITHTSHVRDPVLDPADTDGVRFFPVASPTGMTCLSCHKPHDAMTATGARIMRRGQSQSDLVGVTGKSVNVVIHTDVPDFGVSRGTVIQRKPDAAPAPTGIHRQSDMDGGKRLVINQDPVCDSCH